MTPSPPPAPPYAPPRASPGGSAERRGSRAATAIPWRGGEEEEGRTEVQEAQRRRREGMLTPSPQTLQAAGEGERRAANAP